VIVPSNQDEDTVDGWELNVQHNFGGSGFGVIANATFVDSKTSYDDMLLAQQFVVSGISDSAN
jgi:outer membrane receptor protein involved in Fe transport